MIMDDFRIEVKAIVKEALASIGCQEQFDVEIPPGDAADAAVPCFRLAKTLGKAPAIIAEELASKIQPSGMISSVEAVNGYLNFRIDAKKMVEGTIDDILTSRRKYGRLPDKGIKINLEHTSTNPTGPIHVGRARNPIIGDTLARCLKMCGYDVSTEYYVNDVGKQVVILTWGVENLSEDDVDSSEDRDKTDHKWVAYYRKANRLMEEDQNVSEEISEMLRRFEDGDSVVIDTVRKTAEGMLNGLKSTLSAINVELDAYTWESGFIADGSAKDIVERLKKSKYAGQEDNGAWYLDLKDFGIHGKNTKFTFTRSDGTTLYTTRDLAYHMDKFTRCDRAIDVLGEDQKLGSKQLCSALEILGCEKKPEAMFYSFVSLPEGKMSTRKGVVVYLDDLIDEAISRAYHEIGLRRSDLSEEKMKTIATSIGIGAIRYNMLRVQPEKQLVFRWEDALNFDGNSGPFLQYSYARACSIIRKAGPYIPMADASMTSDESEIKLVKVLSKFPSVIQEAGEMRRIHLLPAYGHEVASAFNQFYASVPVLSAGTNKDARITLVECTKIVLRNVLECMGMGAPEEM